MDKSHDVKDNSFVQNFYASSYRVVDPGEVSFEVDVKFVDSESSGVVQDSLQEESLT